MPFLEAHNILCGIHHIRQWMSSIPINLYIHYPCNCCTTKKKSVYGVYYKMLEYAVYDGTSRGQSLSTDENVCRFTQEKKWKKKKCRKSENDKIIKVRFSFRFHFHQFHATTEPTSMLQAWARLVYLLVLWSIVSFAEKGAVGCCALLVNFLGKFQKFDGISSSPCLLLSFIIIILSYYTIINITQVVFLLYNINRVCNYGYASEVTSHTIFST